MDKDLLGQILVANHFVTKKQLDAALEKQKNSPEHKLLGEILVKDGILTQRALDTILTVQRHKLEMKGEKPAEQPETPAAGPSATQAQKIGTAMVKSLKEELKQDIMAQVEELLKKQLEMSGEKLKREIMDEMRKFVRQQFRRMKK